MGRNITLNAASQYKNSLVRTYYDATLQRVYPYFTAVIDVQKGVVERITWDDACIFCGGLPGECVETTYDFNGNIQNASGARQPTRSCSLSIDQCNSPEIDPSQAHPCDLMLYVVWTGTDANGQALQSHAYRFSEFPAQELADRVTQLLPDFNSGGGGGGSRRRSLSEMVVVPDSWKDWLSSWAR
jgi:hypothetical protein